MPVSISSVSYTHLAGDKKLPVILSGQFYSHMLSESRRTFPDIYSHIQYRSLDHTHQLASVSYTHLDVYKRQRYMNGAATNPEFDVVARAAVQIKNAIDATIELGGSNYVFCLQSLRVS